MGSPGGGVDECAGSAAPLATNRQIAAELVITERTADTHVSSILNKLGLASRGGSWTTCCPSPAAWSSTLRGTLRPRRMTAAGVRTGLLT